MTTPHHDTFSITRTFPHSLDRVWNAWAEPKKKAAWFGSKPDRQAFMVGGHEQHAFTDSMGEHTNSTQYFDICDRERLIFAYSMAINGRIHSVSLATVLFEAVGEGETRLTFTEQMSVLPPSDGRPGREHGWGALLQRLDDRLEAETLI